MSDEAAEEAAQGHRIAYLESELERIRLALLEAITIAQFYAGDGTDEDALAVCKVHAARLIELGRVGSGQVR
jgi:hypothetical protein